MKKFLIVAILQLATSLSYAEEVAITLRSYKIALRHDLKSGSPETRLGWTHISNFLQLISSRHPAVSLIQRRISLISGSPAHCKMDTHTVRRTAQKSIAYLTLSITQTSIILATTMLTNFFMKEAASILMEKKQVAGRCFFNEQEAGNNLS